MEKGITMRQRTVSIACNECGCVHLAKIDRQIALFPVEQVLVCPLTGGTVSVTFEQPIEFVTRPVAA
jgi:hypothetical protein